MKKPVLCWRKLHGKNSCFFHRILCVVLFISNVYYIDLLVYYVMLLASMRVMHLFPNPTRKGPILSVCMFYKGTAQHFCTEAVFQQKIPSLPTASKTPILFSNGGGRTFHYAFVRHVLVKCMALWGEPAAVSDRCTCQNLPLMTFRDQCQA